MCITRIHDLVINICAKEKHDREEENTYNFKFYIHELNHLLDSPLFRNIEICKEIYTLISNHFKSQVQRECEHMMTDRVLRDERDNGNKNEWIDKLRNILTIYDPCLCNLRMIIDHLNLYITMKLGSTFRSLSNDPIYIPNESFRNMYYHVLINNKCLDNIEMLTELNNLL